MYDLTIIGAGVVGSMIARTLSAYDLKVCVIEKENDVAMGASKANSAIVHAGFDAEEGSLKAKLNVKGSQMMEKVAGELGVKYKKNGSLVVGFNDEDKDTIKALYERGNANGVKDLKILSQNEVRELEPNISDEVVAALYAPTGAIICPYELTVAAMGNAMDNDVDLRLNFKVKSITRSEGVYEIKSDAGNLYTSYIVNAAGLFSDEIAALAGDETIKVHPRRGEYILLDKAIGGLVSHTIFPTPSKKGKGILVTPTVDGNLLLGPTSVDMEDKNDTSTHAEGFESIIKQATKSVKGVLLNQTITSFCGLRAAGNTGDFIINSPKENFINVAGIESPGLSASPAIAEYVKELLENSGLKLKKKSGFNPIRKPAHYFREASMEEKNEIIKNNPAFGRVICRCETVTEGEIREAIRTNPPARDLDGVKRRTRAQMGRCQGGFCVPYITGILAKELGIEYEQVTKNGDGSQINIGKTKEENGND